MKAPIQKIKYERWRKTPKVLRMVDSGAGLFSSRVTKNS
jgi:hypothetical protein